MLANRRGVAATTATRTTSRPVASRARWASRAVEPLVSTSSQTTTRTRRCRSPGLRTAAARACMEPRRFAARSVASRPAWSTTPGRSRSSRCTSTSNPSTPELSSRPHRDRAGGVVAARPHRARVGTGPAPAPPGSPAAARHDTAAASSRASGTASPEQPALLQAEHHRPHGALVDRGRPRLDQPRRRRRRPGRRRPARQLALADRAEQAARPRTADARPTQQQVERSVEHGLGHASIAAVARRRSRGALAEPVDSPRVRVSCGRFRGRVRRADQAGALSRRRTTS